MYEAISSRCRLSSAGALMTSRRRRCYLGSRLRPHERALGLAPKGVPRRIARLRPRRARSCAGIARLITARSLASAGRASEHGPRLGDTTISARSRWVFVETNMARRILSTCRSSARGMATVRSSPRAATRAREGGSNAWPAVVASLRWLSSARSTDAPSGAIARYIALAAVPSRRSRSVLMVATAIRACPELFARGLTVTNISTFLSTARSTFLLILGVFSGTLGTPLGSGLAGIPAASLAGSPDVSVRSPRVGVRGSS